MFRLRLIIPNFFQNFIFDDSILTYNLGNDVFSYTYKILSNLLIL